MKTKPATIFALLLTLLAAAFHVSVLSDAEKDAHFSDVSTGMPDEMHRYTYVMQNPWTSFDPEGLATIEEYKKQQAELKVKFDHDMKGAKNDAERNLHTQTFNMINSGIERSIATIENTARKENENQKVVIAKLLYVGAKEDAAKVAAIAPVDASKLDDASQDFKEMRHHQNMRALFKGVEIGGNIVLLRWGSIGGVNAASMAAAERLLAAERAMARQLTVIGHAPDYIKIAEARGANYLKWSADWTWRKQGEFIRSVIQRGDDVLVGTRIRAGDSVLRHEIKQLIKAGYEPSEQGSMLLIKKTP